MVKAVERFAVLFALLTAACEASDPCPDGSMLDGPGALEVTEDEHGVGWGQEECFGCHDEGVLHRTGCTADVDLDAIQMRVEQDGLSSCADCHGTNGGER